MDQPDSPHEPATDTEPGVKTVFAEVTCTWSTGEGDSGGHLTAAVVHLSSALLVLEASEPRPTLPPLGTPMHVSGQVSAVTGRLADHGRAGRFLLALGDRPVRRAARLRVCLQGTLRSPAMSEPLVVEVVDLTTAGARLRGVELPVGSRVTLDFTPPARPDPVSVRAIVAHADPRGLGIEFRLVAMRGGRSV